MTFFSSSMPPVFLMPIASLLAASLFLYSTSPLSAKEPTGAVNMQAKADSHAKQALVKKAYDLVENGNHTRNVLRKAVSLYEKNLEGAQFPPKQHLFYLIDLSRAYQRFGDLVADKDEQLRLYEEGRVTARRAQSLDATSAEAVFWDMANMASLGRARGIASTVMHLPELFKGLRRANALDPKHLYSREILARVYHEVPGVMGGSDDKAIALLEKCIVDDPFFTPCRVTLGKLYVDEDEFAKARPLLLSVLSAKKSSVPADFRKFNIPEAKAALARMKND
ncbi:MAG: hypothetical protein GY822_19460 [Deltaproteobacteria bacterium]|nr:hypothetical protein [Deltaproteobacteria bacterium]